MYVIVDDEDHYASYGDTLGKAIEMWKRDNDSVPDVTKLIVVLGKRKKASIVLTDYPEKPVVQPKAKK